MADVGLISEWQIARGASNQPMTMMMEFSGE